MRSLIPIKENENKGFHYTVTEAEIVAHQKRTIAEIFTWLENTTKFIYTIQTVEERKFSLKNKNS